MASLFKRGNIHWIKYHVNGKRKETSLRTRSLQIAKEKKRQFESAQARGDDCPLPTRTPLTDVLTRYVAFMHTIKTAKSAQTDTYYLREAFGPICDALRITSRRTTVRKRPPRPGTDRRCRPHTIEAACIEQITTADIAAFITAQVRTRGLAPKTANRYREVLHRLFSWAMSQGGVRMPADRNPAAKVERYKERAPEIRFLTLPQIDEQLRALRHKPELQTIVAVYIYAGLRREEALWLTADDMRLSDGANGMIRVRAKTITTPSGGESWQPKTRRNRAVPVSRALRPYLERYPRRPSDGDWYFPSPKATRWDPDNFSADLRAANAEAGLRWACLDYRHTFGSQLAQNNVSLYKIATLMGNSPEICRRHYAALVPEAMAGEVEFNPARNDKGRRVS